MVENKLRRTANLLGFYILSSVITLVFAFPFFWMLSGSLKEASEIFIFPPIMIPSEFQLENYAQVFIDIPFARYLLNSTFVSGVIVIGGLLLNSLASYAFSRLHFPGRDILFTFILATFMIPFQAIVIPLFVLVKSLGWIDTFKALIIPFLFNPFGIFLLRQFFLSVPSELEDSARIDGTSRFGTFFRIILPLSKPALATFAIISFIWSWNSLLWPLVSTQSIDVRLIQVGITEFQTQYWNTWHLLLAASTVGMIPTLAVFLSLQRYYVQGIASTGLKG